MDANERHMSAIRHWNAPKGYGFTSYTDEHGREISLFAHCTQFKNDNRIPQVGDVVEFRIGADKVSRPMAINIKFVDSTDDEGQTDESETKS